MFLRKLLRLLYSRVFIIALLLIVQLAGLLWLARRAAG